MMNLVVTILIAVIFCLTKFYQAERKRWSEELQIQNEIIAACEEKMVENESFIQKVKDSIQNSCNYIRVEYSTGNIPRIVNIQLREDGEIVMIFDDSSGKNIDLHIISDEVEPMGIMLTGIPRINTTIDKKNKLEIIDYPPHSYINRGYGKFLFETLFKIAANHGIRDFYGSLVSHDANTPMDRQRRNNFYRKLGFEVIDDESGKGMISKSL